jgi:hypothetical protein
MMLYKMKGMIIANAIQEPELTDNDPAMSGTVSGVAAPGVSLSVDDSDGSGDLDAVSDVSPPKLDEGDALLVLDAVVVVGSDVLEGCDDLEGCDVLEGPEVLVESGVLVGSEELSVVRASVVSIGLETKKEVIERVAVGSGRKLVAL